MTSFITRPILLFVTQANDPTQARNQIERDLCTDSWGMYFDTLMTDFSIIGEAEPINAKMLTELQQKETPIGAMIAAKRREIGLAAQNPQINEDDFAALCAEFTDLANHSLTPSAQVYNLFSNKYTLPTAEEVATGNWFVVTVEYTPAFGI